MNDQITSAGGWCAPSEVALDPVGLTPLPDLEPVAVRRGGIHFPRPGDRALAWHGPVEPSITITMQETVRYERHWSLRDLAWSMECRPDQVAARLVEAELEHVELAEVADGELLHDLHADPTEVAVLIRAWQVTP